MNVNVSEKNIFSEIAVLIEKGLSSYQSLPELRKEAFQTFQQLGLPGPKVEEYKDTPIARTLQKNFTFQPSRTQGKVNPQEFYIPGFDANIIVFVNGFFSKEHSRIVSPEAEIQITPLKDAVAEKNAEVLKNLGKYADFKTDALVAWNTAAWNEGIFLHVKPNQVVEKPVVLHYIHDSSTEEVSSINRNLIVVGKKQQSNRS